MLYPASTSLCLLPAYISALHSHLASTAGHGFESHFEHFFFINACACVPLSISPWFLRYLNEAGRLAYGRIRYRRPKDPAAQRERECYKGYPGLGNRSIVYPYSSVGNPFTLGLNPHFWVFGFHILGPSALLLSECAANRSRNCLATYLGCRALFSFVLLGREFSSQYACFCVALHRSTRLLPFRPPEAFRPWVWTIVRGFCLYFLPWHPAYECVSFCSLCRKVGRSSYWFALFPPPTTCTFIFVVCFSLGSFSRQY